MTRRDRAALAVLALSVLALSVLAFGVACFLLDGRVDRLERDVACLKHPTHATSSIGPVGLTGVRALVPATLVVCP